MEVYQVIKVVKDLTSYKKRYKSLRSITVLNVLGVILNHPLDKTLFVISKAIVVTIVSEIWPDVLINISTVLAPWKFGSASQFSNLLEVVA